MSEPLLISQQKLVNNYAERHPIEMANLVNTFSQEDTLNYLESLPPGISSKVFSLLSPEHCTEIIKIMDQPLYKQLMGHIDPGLAARLLARLEARERDQKLAMLSKHLAEEIKDILQYPLDTAGYLMDPQVTTFKSDQTVREVLKRLRKIKDKKIVSIFIISHDGKLRSVVDLQEVAIAQPRALLSTLSKPNPISIHAMAPKEDVISLIEDYKILNLPVVDSEGILLGVIRYDAIVNAAKLEVSEDLQTIFGAGKEEKSTSKISLAVRKRLPWLEINLATAFLAAAVVGLFEETIARITVLAVFLPVVAGQSGNTGSQSLAVTMRGLVLREFRPRQWFSIARKETLVGFINGLAVALTTSVIVYIWESSLPLAFIIGFSMVVSMVIAGFSGAVIPIILKGLGQDPAQSSSIILTTVTDVTGFFSFLGLATLMMDTFNIV